MKLQIIITATLFALVAGPAHADPISAIASVFIKIGVGAFAAVSMAQVAFGLGMSMLSSAIARKMQKSPEVSVKFEVEMGDDTPLAFVVGDFATAGKRKYIGSWGPNTRFVTEVFEISCLPQPGQPAIWVNDEPGEVLWGETGTHTDRVKTGRVQKEINSGDGGRTVWVDTYTDKTVTMGHPLTNLQDDGYRIWIKWIDGAQTAADPFLLAVFGEDPDYPWVAGMIGTGKTYAIITTQYDSDTLTSYPQYLFQPPPLPVYDPRKDSTVGGVGGHRWGQRATYEPSRNNAVIAYNIARGIYFGSEWVFGGKNLSAWRLPMAEWVAAMNACDDVVALAGGGTEPAFRCGAEITVDMEPLAVMEEIGRAANMRFAEVGGRLKPIVGLPGAAVLSITDEDILITEAQSFNPFYPVAQTFNALSASYPEPGEKWASKPAPEYVDADATVADGGRYLPTGVTYSAAPFAQQVQRLMRAQMRDYRRMRTHQFSLPPEAFGLEPGVDMISWTSARNGYVNKLLVVESVAKLPGMNVAVTLREADPSDYDWSAAFEQPVIIAPPTVVFPPVVEVSGFSAVGVAVQDSADADRIPGVQVSCSGDIAGIASIRIQLRRVGDAGPLVDVTRPFAAPHSWVITGIAPATSYMVRVQMVPEANAIAAWTDEVEVLTPDIRVTSDDLDPGIADMLDRLHDWIDGGVTDLPGDLALLAGSIAVEIDARVAAVQAQADALAAEASTRSTETRAAADRWRETRDRVHALWAEVVELAAADHTAREEIRRSLTVQVETFRASYTEQIVVLAAADLAAVARIETLEAGSATLTASIQQVDQARVEGETALAQSIASLAVGTATQFDAAAIWHFDASVEGWGGGPVAPAWQAGGWLRPGVGASGYITSPAALAVVAARYRQVRLRLRRTGAPVWTGWLYWAASGEVWDNARRVAILAPEWSGDIGLITVEVPWTGAVDQIRLDLADSTGSAWVDVDWIAIGRPAPGASSADLDALRQTVIDGDQALAEDIAQLTVRLVDAETGLAVAVDAVTGLTTRVGATETGLEATGTRLDGIDATLADQATGMDALASAIDVLEAGAEVTEAGQSVMSQATRDLRSALRLLAAEGVEAAAREALADQAVREYIASASQTLGTRIDATDDQVRLVAEAVTTLQAAIPGLATADALQALTTTVTQQGADLLSVSSAVVSLGANLAALTGTVGDKADAAALSDLAARVTSAEGVNTAQGSAITGLTSSIGTTNGNVAAAQTAADAAAALAGSKGKVLVQSTAPAVADRLPQNLWIDITSGANTPKRWTGSAWAAVTDKIATDAAAAAAAAMALAGTKADASALTALQTLVTEQAGKITAQAEALTQLGALTSAGVAQAILRMSVESSPAGVAARAGLKVLAGDSSDTARTAALFLEALAGGGSRVVIQGDALYLMIGGSSTPLFVADGSGLRINADLIRVDGEMIVEGATSRHFRADATAAVTLAPSTTYTDIVPETSISEFFRATGDQIRSVMVDIYCVVSTQDFAKSELEVAVEVRRADGGYNPLDTVRLTIEPANTTLGASYSLRFPTVPAIDPANLWRFVRVSARNNRPGSTLTVRQLRFCMQQAVN